MKLPQGLRVWTCCLGALLVVANACADPILPYSTPIASQLSNDIAVLEAIPDRTPAENQQLSTSRSALNAYHRNSTTFSTDISILKDLDRLMAETAGYPTLLNDAVNGYIDDFQTRADALETEVLPAPITKSKTNSFGRIQAIRKRLLEAEVRLDRDEQLEDLAYAAGKFKSASNRVHQALKAQKGKTTVWANIGKLSFRSDAQDTEWSFSEGALNIWATNRGSVKRMLNVNVSGIGEGTPATYEIGTNATYIAQDNEKTGKPVYEFQAVTNGLFDLNFLQIDAVTEDFIVGRFRFTAESPVETRPGDTNRFVTITNGYFQLNFED